MQTEAAFFASLAAVLGVAPSTSHADLLAAAQRNIPARRLVDAERAAVRAELERARLELLVAETEFGLVRTRQGLKQGHLLALRAAALGAVGDQIFLPVFDPETGAIGWAVAILENPGRDFFDELLELVLAITHAR